MATVVAIVSVTMGTVRRGCHGDRDPAHPCAHTAHMSSTTVQFAQAARTLTGAARARGLIGPSYRCPPRLRGVDRSLRRRSDGAVVAVRLRDRPWSAVLADMIEGVIVVNELPTSEATRLRTELWELLAPGGAPSARVA